MLAKRFNQMIMAAMIMFLVISLIILFYVTVRPDATTLPWWLYGPWIFVIGQLSILWGLKPSITPKYDWVLTRDGHTGMLVLRQRGVMIQSFIGLHEALEWMRDNRTKDILSVHIDL